MEDSLRVGEEARVALQALRQKYSAAHHAPLMAMAASAEDPALRQKVTPARGWAGQMQALPGAAWRCA